MHGAIFRSDRDSLWYYARELQNGVVLLKIPRELFQSAAAKITLFPDYFQKSGYLWKTLFPKEMSPEKIVECIDESLFHPAKDESEKDIKVGYALLDDPLTALKVRVQLTGTQINSAFPTWGQPATGNNGKPFSHADSVGFALAESTVFFNDKSDFLEQNSQSAFGDTVETLATLRALTPSLFSMRPHYSTVSREMPLRVKWQSTRTQWAQNANGQQIHELVAYLKDVNILKDSFPLLIACYGHAYPKLSKDHDFLTLSAFSQNQLDGFEALAQYDLINSTELAQDYAFLYLRSKFLRFGGLDTWEAKRFHTSILKWVISRDDAALACEYLNALATSPSRIALYSDINFNPYVTEDAAVIGVDEPDIRVLPRHLFRFFGNHISLNYILNMLPDDREELIRCSLSVYFKHFTESMSDQVRHADVSDLTSFGWFVNDIVRVAIKDPSKLNRGALRLILHDYYRMLQLAQVRVISDNSTILTSGKTLPFDNQPNSAYWLYTKIKHQRDWLKILVEISFSEFKKICIAIQDEKLAEFCESCVKRFYKDRVPLPKGVPEEFARWPKHPARQKAGFSVPELMAVMFPGGQER